MMLFTLLSLVAASSWLPGLLCAPAPPYGEIVQHLQTEETTQSQETAQSHLKCDSLMPRREWRSLEPEDRAAWISAVKVRLLDALQ